MHQPAPRRDSLSVCLSLLLLGLLAVSPVYADDYRGRILKVKGEVHIVDDKGERRKLEESRFLVREMDTIITTENGTAVVRFNDGSMSVMSEKSRLRVEKTSWLSHLGGKIYFTFRKVFGEPRRVRTRFATIGVRGTTFIVTDSDDEQGVALKEGQVDVASPEGAFEIHRQQQADEFEAFKQDMAQQRQQMEDEFARYRQQTLQEFVEYKEQFTLQANRVIRFDGKRVDETEMTQQDKQQFESFEAIAGEMLKQFRQQSQQHREALRQQQEAGE